jgi:protein-disulfide isomerase
MEFTSAAEADFLAVFVLCTPGRRAPPAVADSDPQARLLPVDKRLAARAGKSLLREIISSSMVPSERRFFTLFLRRLAFVSLLLCLGCRAQQNAPAVTPDVNERIQRQVRSYFNIPPDVSISIGTPTASEFPNYELVSVTMTRQGKTQKTDFLLSKDGKTLIRFTKLDLTKDPYAETMKEITVTDRPMRGNPDAKVTIVNFDDFECPFCARMHTTLMSEILPQYKDKIKIVYKDYPLLQIHPWAQHAANDANCLAKENGSAYWELADYLHSNQRAIHSSPQDPQAAFNEIDKQTLDVGKKNGVDMTQLQACLKAQSDTVVKASMAEGDKVGVSATPTVFINGERLEGALDVDEVKAALNRQLLAAGVQPPAAPPAPAPTPAQAAPATTAPAAQPPHPQTSSK